MTATASGLDLAAIKTRQQQTWASGDFAVIASRIVLVSELLADNANLRAGWRVLDVACGNGNATLAAARSGTSAVGVDYVSELLESGRTRAVAEGLDVELRLGDAEALPFKDGSFDAALSVFGAMFAPDHHRAAGEILRVVRPGGTVGLASWKPDGFIGEMFKVTGSYVAPPAAVQSPLLWGTPSHLADIFAGAADDAVSVERTCTFRYASPEAYVTDFRRWYGPTLQAFNSLDADGQAGLAADLAALARAHDSHRDGGSIAIRATYLETVFTVR